MLTYLQILEWFRSKEQEEGQTLVEYALLLVLIAIVVIVAVTAIGGNANLIFEKIRDALVFTTP